MITLPGAKGEWLRQWAFRGRLWPGSKGQMIHKTISSHKEKGPPRGTCSRVCNVQMAEGMGLSSNLLQYKSLIYIETVQAPRYLTA